MSSPTGALSDRRVVGKARFLRLAGYGLEAGLYAVVAGSVLAFGSVHPWAYVPLWCGCLVLAILLAEHVLTARALRRIVGPRRVSFHPTGLWIVLDEEPPYGLRAWSLDLARPSSPTGPLFRCGLAFLALVLLQLLPLPASLAVLVNGRHADSVTHGATGWLSETISVPDTARGLAFLASLLALHAVAGTVLDRRQGRDRFRWFVALLGLVLSLLALAQMASGTELIYWFFRPLEWDGTVSIFGPFVSRNHFGGYMLMVAPLAMGLAVQSVRRYAKRVGERANLRRWLVGVSSPEGTALIYSFACAPAAVAALVASRSRGALLAFVVSLVLAGLGLGGRRRLATWLLPLLFAALAVSWFGAERAFERFSFAVQDVPTRTVVWQDVLRRMNGLWYLGSGFNTFSSAMTRVTAWTLPRGATPWSEPYETSIALPPRTGFLTPVGLPGLQWYREAHNDYIQTLVETGVPGLALALFAIAVLLRSVRGDPWLLAALGGVVLHCVVDFDLQIPAIAVLFVTLAAMPAASSANEPSDP